MSSYSSEASHTLSVSEDEDESDYDEDEEGSEE